MLNAQLIKASEALKGLSEEQITAIVTLSMNDEQVVIGQRIGELHGQYDADIKAVTGIEKPQGVKTYDHLKTVLKDLKTKADSTSGITSQLETLKTEKAELEKALKNNSGDATLKSQLEENEKLVGKLRKSLEDKETEFKGKLSQIETETANLKFETEFERSLQGVTFKDEKVIPAAVRDTYITNVRSKILASNKHSYVKTEGKPQLVFLDENGEILRNPSNGLLPVTLKELAIKELEPIIDPGRKQTGTGSNGGSGGGGVSVDLGGARTKVQATEAIEKTLLSDGMLRTDPAFAAKTLELLQSSGGDKLPMTI